MLATAFSLASLASALSAPFLYGLFRLWCCFVFVPLSGLVSGTLLVAALLLLSCHRGLRVDVVCGDALLVSVWFLDVDCR